MFTETVGGYNFLQFFFLQKIEVIVKEVYEALWNDEGVEQWFPFGYSEFVEAPSRNFEDTFEKKWSLPCVKFPKTKSPHPKKRSPFFVACLFHQLSRWSGLKKKMPAVYGWKNQHPTILHKPAFLLSLSTHFGAFLRWQGYVF